MLRKLFGRGARKDNLSTPRQFEMFSRTATLVIFDLERLSHRVDDDVDWWAEAEPEVAELHGRNLIVAGLNANDWYDVSVGNDEVHDSTKYSLAVPSGRVFVGSGEEISGGGREPTGQHGGVILALEPGDYEVSFEREDQKIAVQIRKSEAFSNEQFGQVFI